MARSRVPRCLCTTLVMTNTKHKDPPSISSCYRWISISCLAVLRKSVGLLARSAQPKRAVGTGFMSGFSFAIAQTPPFIRCDA